MKLFVFFIVLLSSLGTCQSSLAKETNSGIGARIDLSHLKLTLPVRASKTAEGHPMKAYATCLSKYPDPSESYLRR